MDNGTRSPDGITVFSGGTAANSLVDVFNKLVEKRRCKLSYVIPISDNGGSSSELIRFVGGPSVGDIRSRLVRLIPNPDGDEERTSLKALFEYRLSADPTKARSEWLDIVEARHLLWTFVSSPKRDLIRSVLSELNAEIVKRARPTSVFNFAQASIGNMFLSGARLFTGSFESAIYLLSMICAIPDSVSVLPAINSNFTHHISASLVNGTQITGQVAISHPSAPTSLPDDSVQQASGAQAQAPRELLERFEDANLPGSLPALRRQNIAFSKDDEDDDLPAPIERVWYINPYGHEIWPVANPKVLAALRASRTVVYSIGSLYTSVIPSLILRGVGAAITAEGVRHKVLILNASIDRETGPRTAPMTGLDFVRAVAKAGAESQCVFDPNAVPDQDLRRYVTHILFLTHPGAPAVDVKEIGMLGIECVQLPGRTVQNGKRAALRYDETSLMAALEGIMAS